MKPRHILLTDDPSWYKDAVIYQVHVKSFLDSNGDGIGDFQGLIKKLDYLQNLSINVIWLLPFYPSPLKDDGYDIADYFDIHPDYGSLKDFQEFLKSAHYRGIRVITELVINHTSDQHRWFQLARRSHTDSPFRDYYVWSDTPNKYQEARIIFQDFETSNWSWDPIAQAYFWHRFYSHQPDLNFDNPEVQKAVFKVIDFWLDMGVDGLRLDAVPYLFEREGTNCENLPETHQFLKRLRAYVDEKYSNRMLLAEANQWPEDAVAYFGENDECHMAFHFPIMPRMFMSIWMEDRFPLMDIIEQTPPLPPDCQWAIFLRNHDELTLEMVTDEERDYMYRIYAKDSRARINLGIRRRLAPLLNNNRRKIELLYFLLFSLPGTPIIYYGDEIGMGDNYFLGDRNGVRTPMQWSPDKNAGFSDTNPQKLYLPMILDPEYHYEVINAENQDKNLSSLLWWLRRVISMRKKFRSFGRGEIEFLYPENPKILAFLRQYQEETLLVIINLSRYAQVAELELSKYSGYIPIEVFSGNKFPMVREHPYVFTLGIHDYFWFTLKKEKEQTMIETGSYKSELSLPGSSWQIILKDAYRGRLESEVLPNFLPKCRWFRSKTSVIRSVSIREDITISDKEQTHHLLLLEVDYTEGSSELYLLPLSFIEEPLAHRLEDESPQAVIARIYLEGSTGIIYDGVFSPDFRGKLLKILSRDESIYGVKGQLMTSSSRQGRVQFEEKDTSLESFLLKTEQSNTSILYQSDFYLKLYRKVEEGVNPDSEITAYLSNDRQFPNVPPHLANLEYRFPHSEPITLGLLQEYVYNQGDAWNFSLDHLEHYFEALLSHKHEIQTRPEISYSYFKSDFETIPEMLKNCFGGYFLEMISLLGKITGELHLSLAQETNNSAFRPEPFSTLYQRSLYQSMRHLVRRNLSFLRKNKDTLTDELKEEANNLLSNEQTILTALGRITEQKIHSQKIRIHGDYHLGQVLFTGNNFVIIDFEGEPARALSERRLKRSCFRDIAGMIRSFHYAAYAALYKQASIRPDDIPFLQDWIRPWYQITEGSFLKGYLDTVAKAPFIPEKRSEMDILLNTFLLEKAVYELGYELNNRPDWVHLPIQGIKQILAI